ncbi:oxygen-independent coproporphyrinogen-3 oxidase [Filimonas lacunae]|uniref:Coproporphyrinogen-III oxidase n=1 Tax=Filimonas lacunae TaxID=477680 RepID=A0A173MNL6_9BACT|nr:oxygen-independent coproporphyrinogen III oxidase [Filimonas lacunae]BAV09040.1 coproporphyrinogen III oxidase, oxygen-independent [Filimonas lacunae]SIS66271.1 oxygen-independent coproporphyrinogen-3 oxidase [Filimonas lacunae]
MSVPVALLHQYNIPVPRYTSYPTVPVWPADIDYDRWIVTAGEQLTSHAASKGISLYIHLPFCESLCTYCGCNKKITTNHNVEVPYIDAVLKEWELYVQQLPQKPVIKELHLGGGTPTFFSPENLERLLSGIFELGTLAPTPEMSFEGHPGNTTAEHLLTFYNLGFRRVSFGVQDLDPQVQHVINRIQPFEQLEEVTRLARNIGYQSVNFDLIYGLPLQTIDSITNTINRSLELHPDRIAFYSYAHVPWTSKAQRLFSEADLPTAAVKLLLYQQGKRIFAEHGYQDIGMDHFAIPGDALYKAQQTGMLHRNFMGYTTQHTAVLVGLGVSAISDIGIAYAQNEKTIHDYYQRLENNELPVAKGIFLTEEDRLFKQYILDISCRGKTTFVNKYREQLEQYSYPELDQLEADDLIYRNSNGIKVTDTGKNFIRNICRAFDLHLLRNGESGDRPMFSKAV